jgi:hypothetical protein
MRLVRDQGGHSIAVYRPGSPKQKRRAEKLITDMRADFSAPANYSKGKHLDRIVCAIIDKIVVNNVGSLDLDAALAPLLSDPALRKSAADLIAEITAKLPRGVHTNDLPVADDLDGILQDARSLVLGRVSPER